MKVESQERETTNEREKNEKDQTSLVNRAEG